MAFAFAFPDGDYNRGGGAGGRPSHTATFHSSALTGRSLSDLLQEAFALLGVLDDIQGNGLRRNIIPYHIIMSFLHISFQAVWTSTTEGTDAQRYRHSTPHSLYLPQVIKLAELPPYNILPTTHCPVRNSRLSLHPSSYSILDTSVLFEVSTPARLGNTRPGFGTH